MMGKKKKSLCNFFHQSAGNTKKQRPLKRKRNTHDVYLSNSQKALRVALQKG